MVCCDRHISLQTIESHVQGLEQGAGYGNLRVIWESVCSVALAVARAANVVILFRSTPSTKKPFSRSELGHSADTLTPSMS
jgi:hypothetical protein